MFHKSKHPCSLSLLAKGAAMVAALLCSSLVSLWSQETPGWPRTITNTGGTLILYHPQIDAWKNYQTVDARIAFSITPTGGKQHVGVATVSMNTATDMDTHTVILSNPQITSLYFPSLDATTKAQMETLVRSFLKPTETMTTSVDQLAASVKKTAPAKTVSVNNDPPVIFISFSPAILLMVNGEPVKASVGQTNVKAIVNANWPLFQDQVTSTYYLFDGKGWLQGANFENWQPTATLPADMSQVSLSPNWKDLASFIPPPPGSTTAVPAVYYSSKPAEIVVFNGKPDWVAITGTQLSYPANTDSTILKYTPSGAYYFLTSGRWFTSTDPLGPWTFATDSLPADFAKIPPSSPAGKVLAFVPGTPEAEDAVLLAQVPTTVTINPKNAAAEVKVTYVGTPDFAPITGTTLYYATNTSYRVIQLNTTQYYLCYQGVWFLSSTPNGPWTVPATVPPAIYTIPPSSPVYNVTYVTQAPASNGDVTASYTAGYLGTFVTGFAVGAIVADGTGWYYPPYIYGGWYYPYPCTYGYHNWYNPYTGAYGWGGSAYGPYGSAHWGEGYNPNTGTYARGGEVNTAYGSLAAGQAYNPYTGAYAATRQGSNAYGSWGQSVYSKNGQTAYSQHASNAYGSEGSVHSTTGAEAGGVSTAHGTTAAGKTANGDMYAGHDGNVYQNTGSGWQKYDNGSWNDVNKSTAQQSFNQQHPDSSSYNRSGGGTYGGLDQDAQDRSRGDTQNQRFSDYQHSGGWGGADRSSGGWGGGGDRWGGGGMAGRSWGGRR